MAVILKLFNMKPKSEVKMAKIPEIPENTSDFLGMYRFH